MSGPQRLINRELSWLEFNQRVLDEARCGTTPLLERLRFLAITASNLDEFFMVRVGGLKSGTEAAVVPEGPRRSVAEQLADISQRVRAMIAAQYDCLSGDLEPALRQEGVVRLQPEELSVKDSLYLQDYCRHWIEPVVSPVAVGRSRRLPLQRPLGLHLIVRLKPRPGCGRRLAVIPIEPGVDRLVPLPGSEGWRYVLAEDVVRACGQRLFAGEAIAECVPFRITRNADMAVDEDGDVDLVSGMTRVLKERRTGECVRLEIAAGATATVRGWLMRQFGLSAQDVYEIPGPLDLTYLHALAGLEGFDRLRHRPWPPILPSGIDLSRSLFEQIARRDLLLVHPYESYDPVVRLIEEAAGDPQVLSIKMTLYRTSHDSRIIQALSRAAQANKYVTAVLELKARFDEARNIQWARQMAEDGVQVIYGVRGFKTHAKICLIVRREPTGLVRYMHFGTGNYNESTARLYTDLSLMTCDPVLGPDATAFFNAITGYSVEQNLQALAMAPSGLRRRLLELIRGETERCRRGQRARIVAKMNSLVDRALIDALYEASQAGVRILLNVRGICCLRPGVPGLSETIRVVSVVGRFLEHGRVFHFLHGGDDLVFISSADWMPRNLDRRVELMVPVRDPEHRRRLIRLLEVCCSDEVKGRDILPDGGYRPRRPTSPEALSSQESLYREVVERERDEVQRRRTTFDPMGPGVEAPPKPGA